MENKPSFYAIVPAFVRYDTNITANAKLLYGELTALSNKYGYCFAKNKYFADIYNVDVRTIRRWISELIKSGHVFTNDNDDSDTRKIYIKQPQNVGEDKNVLGGGQKCPGGRTKMSSDMSEISSNESYIEPQNEDLETPISTINSTSISTKQSFVREKEDYEEIELDADGMPVKKEPRKKPTLGVKKLAEEYVKLRESQYLEKTGDKLFKSNEERAREIARNLKPASTLIQGNYSMREIGDCMKYCDENYTEWALETIVKKIATYKLYKK